MKKIKYLMFILPLLFITNVKAATVNYFHNMPDKPGYELNINNSNLNYYTNSNYNVYRFNISDGFSVNSTYTFWYLTDYGRYSTIRFVNSNNQVIFDNNSYGFIVEDRTTVNRKFLYSKTFTIPQDTSYFEIASPNDSYIIQRQLEPGSEVTSYIEYSSPVQTYTYTFKVDDTVYVTDTVEEGTIVSLPEPPTKEGYTFTGWTLNGESYTGGEIHDNIEIIANFEEIVVTPEPEPETPSETPKIDISGLVPYLLLISALLMLIILRDFIKNLFKSRR